MPNKGQNDKSIKDKHQQEKNRIQKDIANKAKPRCRICGKFLYEPPQCFGHGGGGSGSESASETTNKDDGKGLSSNSNKKSDIISSASSAKTSILPITNSTKTMPLTNDKNDKKFNTKIISELLSKKLLVLNNDREKGSLTIKLLCDLMLLSREQKSELNKFIVAILKELEEFKKENNISASCHIMKQDKEGNITSLQVTLPKPDLYDTFIQRLVSKHLLPLQNIKQQENQKITYPEDVDCFNPTPFPTKPTPSGKKNSDEEKEETHIRPKSPIDRLKTKE